MDKKTVNWVIQEGKFLIQQDVSTGIQIKSQQAIRLHSEQNIDLQAPRIQITAKEEISLEVKDSSLILDNDTHFKGTKISELGEPVPVFYHKHTS